MRTNRHLSFGNTSKPLSNIGIFKFITDSTPVIMAAAWRPVNSSRAPDIDTIREEAMTPLPATTPRPSTAPDAQPTGRLDHGTTSTPTPAPPSPHCKDGQKPLPSTPFRQSVLPESDAPKQPNPESMDVEMDDDSDGEVDDDGAAASEDESLNADTSTKSGKKKKSQKFYCTDYPPCQLSFTRSEHLARHIR